MESSERQAALVQLEDSLPCRRTQVRLLVSLMGQPHHITPSAIFIYGHTATGKSAVMETILAKLNLPCVFVNCTECYSQRFLFEHILNGLHGNTDISVSVEKERCDNMNDFIRKFQDLVVEKSLDKETVYIVLDKAERLRDKDANILPVFLRLQELTKRNVCVVLLSEIVWEKFRFGTGFPDPYILCFPDYTKDELIEIMALERPSEYSENFYRLYLNLVLSMFYLVCRDLKELQHLAILNFARYVQPIESGEASVTDTKKLWRNIEPHLKKALQTVYLREISSNQWERMQQDSEIAHMTSSQGMSSRSHVELPFYSKYLLIAAYLASYNPAKFDRRFFAKNSGKTSKKSKLTKKHERTSNHMLGPKAFPLDRLMAIFYSIVEGRVCLTANIFMQISSLVTLHLLASVSGNDQIDTPKYKCLVSLEFVKSISRTVNFDVLRYLYDFISTLSEKVNKILYMTSMMPNQEGIMGNVRYIYSFVFLPVKMILRLTVLLVVCVLNFDPVGAMLPTVSPFFFLCNYHGRAPDLGIEHGEIAVSVAVAGDPEYYVPGLFYNVTITSSLSFDAFLLTGLYTISSSYLAAMQGFGIQGNGQPVGQNLMCSVIHSAMAQQPQHHLSFMWMAPPTGTGCVSFLATATLQQQLLFKDTVVFQLCEQGAATTSPLRPELASIHSDGVILRDDFDSSDDFDRTIWSAHDGSTVGDDCGTVLFGDSAVFCKDGHKRELRSVPLNLTSAAALQFAISAGHCGKEEHDDNDIIVSAGLFGCTSWQEIDRIKAPKKLHHGTETHLVHLPPRVRQNNVCIRWKQGVKPIFPPVILADQPETPLVDDPTVLKSRGKAGSKTKIKPKYKVNGKVIGTVGGESRDAGSSSDQSLGTFKGCWALDNVMVVNSADTPSGMQDDFDPIDPSNWVFFPGANIKHKCRSESNAMLFGLDNQTVNYVVTRDLDLQAYNPSGDILLQENFELRGQPGWEMTGGRVDETCGVIEGGKAMVFDERGKRVICTPFINTSDAGNLRFYFGKVCSGTCDVTDSNKNSVIVYLEDNHGQSFVLQKLEPEDYKEPRLVSIVIEPLERKPLAKVCFLQKSNGGVGQDVWAVDRVEVLRNLPEHGAQERDKVVQFSINMQCGSNLDNNQVNLEFSTNHGHSWNLLHTPCFAGSCPGNHQPVDSTFSSVDFPHWSRVTLPLPYAAQTPHVRFRWNQTSPDTPNWALDKVFIGQCPGRCSGHGYCVKNACHCDFGYRGPQCEQSVLPNPQTLIENFVDPSVLVSSSLIHVMGGGMNYDCGVVSTDKPVVFNSGGTRMLETTEFNTTDNRYLQFNIRVGSDSSTSKCPAPDHPSEGVVLDYSCDGGTTWHLLKYFSTTEYRQPRSDMVMLPPHAKGPGCRFRWWQPHHSGPQQDVWAVDDVLLTNHLFNTLDIEMKDIGNTTDRLTINGGKLTDSYCGKPKSLSFLSPRKENESRFLMTESMPIGPSYMMQFDLVMGCKKPYNPTLDNHLYLEYSKDHGLSWSLVEDPCLPPSTCDEFRAGTVFDASQYPEWTRVMVLLPPATWGPGTRFRLRQSDWSMSDSWSVARLYIGQQCPDMCNGHGQCVEGFCKCDNGFNGDNCIPAGQLDPSIQADFGMRYEPEKDFLHIIGGEVTNGNRGCGILLSGESVYFSKDGVREIQTRAVDTTTDDYIQFHIRIGGDDPTCSGGDKRTEGVLLQYSTDGGITWNLLEELMHDQYHRPKFVHVDLPDKAKAASTQFRWWQPSHSGEGHDQWAVDEIRIGRYENLRGIEDDFDNFVDPLDSGQWMTVTEGVLGKFCQTLDPTLVLGNQKNDKHIITKDLNLQPTDVIQFKINVECSGLFRWDHPVSLQYSHDNGQTWSLVQDPCYQEMDCNGKHTEGSIYYSGTHGQWTLVVLPVGDKIAMHPTLIRWWQPGGYEHSFALNDVYIGPPCPANCWRHGVCKQGVCVCDDGFSGPTCNSTDKKPYGMIDRFDNNHEPNEYWQQILGGHLGIGCGVVDTGNSLYFSGDGTREAVTVPLNTEHLRVLQFVVKIGSEAGGHKCRRPQSRNEGIIADYSTDNGVTWNILKMAEPQIHNGTTQTVTIELPPEAKTDNTIFRMWQPLGYGGMPRAQWALDSVLVGINDTNNDGFQDDFAGMMPDPLRWFMTENAIPRAACKSGGNALEFSRNGGTRVAETWDYHTTPSTFLQFDIAMGCDSLYDTLYGVMLEYSVNMGKTWHPMVHECSPPDFECTGYHLGSNYQSDQHRDWTRVTVPLSPGAISPATRFRWKQSGTTQRGNVWALDNVYLGDGCPWLCSGHGYCDKKKCVCDEGFVGEYCTPEKPLPMMLRDDFNRDDTQNDNWKEVYGGEVSDVCGHLVSDKALTFYKDNLRLGVTKDIDTTMLNTIEFYFKYGCDGKQFDWPRSESVLLQYSRNGGITWHLLKEIHYRNETGRRFFSLDLPIGAQTNVTRFRFWQPKNGGEMHSAWAVDNLFIGRMGMNPSSMEDNFNSDTWDDSWLFVNDGQIGQYCTQYTRPESPSAGTSAMVFRRRPQSGEHSIVTRDLDVGPMSVLQFDLNVGCGSDATYKYPVRLEYSADGGKSWSLLVPNCAEISTARCYDGDLPTTLYYGGTTPYWRRVVVPLDTIHVCGSLRFRWYQGFVPEDDFAPEWAIDNLFIGMACMEHCLGHGVCTDMMSCQCDLGYHGDMCVPSDQKPTYLKDDFSISNENYIFPGRGDLKPIESIPDSEQQLDKNRWLVWSGGEKSLDCGVLVTGPSLYFDQTGERSLVTKELDLTKASTVEFVLKLGLEQFDFNEESNKPNYFIKHLPERARTGATQLRWWQPSVDGLFVEDWAVDQIYVGGDIYGNDLLQDDPMSPSESSWLLYPGGSIEKVCGAAHEAILFAGSEKMRYAISADVTVDENTFMQFEIALGCEISEECYEIELQFSLDMGKTWSLLQPSCLPSNIDCHQYFSSTVYRSDVHAGWNQVTLRLPYYTRSKATRFRWLQKEGFKSSQSWALAHMHIGKDCPSMCKGHGRCIAGTCQCDDGWLDVDCGIPAIHLPRSVYDTMTGKADPNIWSRVVGGSVTEICRNLASGTALHFTGGCTRLLISQDLDLTDAVFIQFYFLFGCNAAPTTRDQSVLVDFSVDGGITWVHISELYYNLYRSPTFVNVKLPPDAKELGVRVRFWQPEHAGPLLSDWAIDNVRIGGMSDNPDRMLSDFSNELNDTEWFTSDNMGVSNYCGLSDVAEGHTQLDEHSTLTTKDLAIHEGHMLQFMINIGCDQPWNASHLPVHLQYSTDAGVTWSHLHPQCLPNDPRCKNGASMPSVYYGQPGGGWQRVTLPLDGMPVSSATRFRWTQMPGESGETGRHWALRDVYIGAACPRMCSGRGQCHFPACTCDHGYMGGDCQHVLDPNPTHLKDTFDGPM
ncbi:hypothetical protein ScPMuIL_008029 [Solemya velum]